MSRYSKECYDDVARILFVYGVDKRIVDTFADLFAADNSLFDREKFLAACGLVTEPDDQPYSSAELEVRRDS